MLPRREWPLGKHGVGFLIGFLMENQLPVRVGGCSYELNMESTFQNLVFACVSHCHTNRPFWRVILFKSQGEGL